MQDVITVTALIAATAVAIAAICMAAITRHHMRLTAGCQRSHGAPELAATQSAPVGFRPGTEAAPATQARRPAVTMVRLFTVAATISAGLWADAHFDWHSEGLIAVAVTTAIAWAIIMRATRRRGQ